MVVEMAVCSAEKMEPGKVDEMVVQMVHATADVMVEMKVHGKVGHSDD